MNTIEIGAEIAAVRLPVTHAWSRNLHVESRVECIGVAEGDLYHARSFGKFRRVVLISGLPREDRARYLVLLDELPPLQACETIAALDGVMLRKPNSKPTSAHNACVLQVDRARFDWAAWGQCLLILHRHQSFWREEAIMRVRGDTGPTTSGSTPLATGDAVICFVGSGLADEKVAELLSTPSHQRGDLARAAGAKGCLAVVQRVNSGKRA